MKSILAACAAAALALTLAACSSAGGGSTSCGDFLSMGSSDQTQTIQNMINERHGNSSSGEVDLTYVSVKAYCFLHSSGDPIDGIYSG